MADPGRDAKCLRGDVTRVVAMFKKLECQNTALNTTDLALIHQDF